MTRRQEQLNSRIIEILNTVLQTEMQDPRLQMVTLTRVQVNRDASHATLYFISSDEDFEAREVEGAMTRAKGYFRSVLAEAMDLRYTPDLSFRWDHAYEESERVLALFDEIAEERDRNPPQIDEDAGADE